jgi:cation:H+ antiporter
VDATLISLFVLGLVLLASGAELLVRGAAKLATRLGISPLVIGLTVVAFCTSAPELAVSLQAGFAGQDDMALGNIVGSNIINILLILGISALLVPLVVSQQLVRFDVPLLIGASVLLLILALDGKVGFFDGVILVSCGLAYTVIALRQSRRECTAVQHEYERENGDHGSVWLDRLPVLIARIIIGLVLLVLGARWLVDGAVAIAQLFGISELIIGLTIIAAGTSMPEVATSLIAALRGQRDIAVGNAIGSSLFNILAVAGLSAIFTPGGLEVTKALLNFDILVMIAVAFACLPIFVTGHKIVRWEGALFLAYYLTYVLYLILTATQHAFLPAFSSTLLIFVLPLTAMTLLVSLVHHRQSQRENQL